MKVIFVAGTDTGAGKTVITGLLADYLLKKGFKVATQKWIQTGSRHFSKDIGMHLKLMGKGKEDYSGYLPLMMPYIFRYPSSPHLAASMEDRRIGIGKIRKGLEKLIKDFDYIIAEGTGGLLVPFNKKNLLIDAVEELRLPVLLVAENRVGAINHTLLSLEAMKTRKIKIIGVVFNNISKKKASSTILNDNVNIVKRFSRVKLFAHMSYAGNIEAARRRFLPIGDKIFMQL